MCDYCQTGRAGEGGGSRNYLKSELHPIKLQNYKSFHNSLGFLVFRYYSNRLVGQSLDSIPYSCTLFFCLILYHPFSLTHIYSLSLSLSHTLSIYLNPTSGFDLSLFSFYNIIIPHLLKTFLSSLIIFHLVLFLIKYINILDNITKNMYL